MMFRRDGNTIHGVLIHGREWSVVLTPTVRIAPTSVGSTDVLRAYLAETWFVDNQALFDLQGLN
jgi:hypothetical protein